MKKLIVVLMGVLLLAGCGAAARESGFYEHNTMYANGNHWLFSMCGYKKQIDLKKVQQSKSENWWGITVEGTKP